MATTQLLTIQFSMFINMAKQLIKRLMRFLALKALIMCVGEDTTVPYNINMNLAYAIYV